MEQQGEEFRITEDILAAAAEESMSIMQVLLRLRCQDTEIKFTDKVMRAAIENQDIEEFLQLLSDQRNATIEITHGTLEEVAKNAAADREVKVLDLLFQKCRLPPSNAGKVYNAAKLDDAAEAGEEEMVIQLLGEGVSPNFANSYGYTPLWRAAGRGHTRIVQRLLETGDANIESTDSHNRTVLYYAGARDDEEIVRILLDGGAKLDRKDTFGDSPLRLAQRYEAWRSVKVMKEFERSQRAE